MYSFPENLLHLQHSDESKSPDLDLATGVANTAGLVRCRLLLWEQQIRCCHAVSGSGHVYKAQQTLFLWKHTQILCLNLFAKQSPLQCFLYSLISPHVCILFIHSAAVILVPEQLNVFYIAVNCEWAQVGVCVGVVELPARRGSSTDRLFTRRLSIPELGSTRNPLISTSHLTKQHRGVPPEFMIMK